MASPLPVTRRSDIDLKVLWQRTLSAARLVQRWPLFKWLTPDVPVRVLRSDGAEAVWLGEASSAGKAGARRPGAFVAVELPEDLVLRRRMLMPAVQDSDIANAAELEVRGVAPFPAEDLAWGFCRRRAASGAIEVEIALASRKQVNQYLSAAVPRLEKLGLPEVWAVSAHGAPIVFTGYGENRRTSNAAAWRRVGYGLLIVGLALIMAIVLTPVAQLRMRTIEADAAFQALQAQSATVVQQREKFLKNAEKLTALSTLLADTIDPLAAMDLLTRVLPDDTSLLSLQVQGLKVNISGQTTNAAALMQLLSAQEGLREVKAPGASMRPPGASKEAFNIELMLDPKIFAATPVLPVLPQASSRNPNAGSPTQAVVLPPSAPAITAGAQPLQPPSAVITPIPAPAARSDIRPAAPAAAPLTASPGGGAVFGGTAPPPSPAPEGRAP
jgi:general secretion pathway protein L